MLHIILFRPEIPQNTGNIGRLCAFTGSRLHLIHPLGFKITDSQLKRAGMDYWKSLDVHHHENWEEFIEEWQGTNAHPQPLPQGGENISGLRPATPGEKPKGNLWLFTTHATKNLWELRGERFADGDGLIFGNEGHGAPDWLHEFVGQRRLRIPSFEKDGVKLRSLNLSTSVGIAAYEALRQIKSV
jgi:tRNA (cytidine/uridine-2'-O-)-methyltransferase